MTPRETAAFNAGIEAARQMAMVAAVSIEVRDDGTELRQRAAAAALFGFAEGAAVLIASPTTEAEDGKTEPAQPPLL